MRNVLPLLAAAFMLPAMALAAGRTVDWRSLQPVGKPLDCLSVIRLGQSQVRADDVIDFEAPGRKIYRNTLPGGGCPELRAEGSFSFRTSISQLCSGDIITVFRHTTPGMPGASCGLGAFQQVVPPAG